MEQPGGWGWGFAIPHMLRSWLDTETAAGNYFSFGQIVTVAMATHVGGLWCCYLLLANARSLAPISNSNEFRRFLFSLPEFPVWCAATVALKVAIVVTFFMPSRGMLVAVACYVIGLYLWMAYLNLQASRSLRVAAADERLLGGLELEAASSRKQNQEQNRTEQKID